LGIRSVPGLDLDGLFQYLLSWCVGVIASPRDRTVRVAPRYDSRRRSADWWWQQCRSSLRGRTISPREFAARKTIP